MLILNIGQTFLIVLLARANNFLMCIMRVVNQGTTSSKGLWVYSLFYTSFDKNCDTFQPLHKFKLLYVIMKHMDIAHYVGQSILLYAQALISWQTFAQNICARKKYCCP